MKKFHVGTSGWSYDHWKGVFYPKDMTSKDYLNYYKNHLDCVELNTCFYRLPKKKTVLKWRNETPKDFLFCPKLSRYITHIKKLNEAHDPLKGFLDLFRSMKNKLGPILVQLPSNVHFTNSHVKDFCKLLHRYRSFQFAIEARHPSWCSTEALELLKQKQIGWVIADSEEYPTKEAITSDYVYLRFHGPGELYASNYPLQTLKKYAKKAKQWQREGKEVWAFFNNDAKGFAAKNALTFQSLLKQ